ncbi:STAS domain-containing protein [Streptomyces sp. NPDC005648]|uniref:STAS domain-containing protein n=1 Tax=Streptomyces sp. NPDC005648 TaxID=3157044 RepID=UPI0033A41ADA
MGTPYRTPPGPARAPRLTVFPLPGESGLRVGGEVGLATLPVWERALARAVHGADRVYRLELAAYRLELSAVSFVDVAGADALVAAARSLDEGRRIVLQQPPPTLRRLLDLFWPGVPTIEMSPRAGGRPSSDGPADRPPGAEGQPTSHPRPPRPTPAAPRPPTAPRNDWPPPTHAPRLPEEQQPPGETPSPGGPPSSGEQQSPGGPSSPGGPPSLGGPPSSGESLWDGGMPSAPGRPSPGEPPSTWQPGSASELAAGRLSGAVGESSHAWQPGAVGGGSFWVGGFAS